MDAIRLPSLGTRFPERHLFYDLGALRKPVTVKPEGMGLLSIETEIHSGKISGASAIMITDDIEIKDAHDRTLVVTVRGIGCVRGATAFAAVETDEYVAEMEIRPGEDGTGLKIRFGHIQIDVSGTSAILVPEERSPLLVRTAENLHRVA